MNFFRRDAGPGFYARDINAVAGSLGALVDRLDDIVEDATADIETRQETITDLQEDISELSGEIRRALNIRERVMRVLTATDNIDPTR